MAGEKYSKYKKEDEISYTLGAFPTFELIKNKPELVTEVVVHSTFTDTEKLKALCDEKGITISCQDKLIAKLSDKENCFVVGFFKKQENKLSHDKPHLMLVNPGNMGNLGTILRTATAFNIVDVAIISPGADVFNPKTVRASMGALFHVNVKYFDTFEEYISEYPEHKCYCFMLTGEKQLSVTETVKTKNYTLVFGNEATGLLDDYKEKGEAILIPQSDMVDSLNITIAVGIACFVFANS